METTPTIQPEKMPQATNQSKTVWAMAIITILAMTIAIVLGYLLLSIKSEPAQLPTPTSPQAVIPSNPTPLPTPTPIVAASDFTPIPIVKFSNFTGDKWELFLGIKKIATLNYPSGPNDPTPIVFALTNRYAFIGTCPGEFGGYILYEVCPAAVDQVDLTNGKIVKSYSTQAYNGGAHGIFEDVSPDGKWLTYSLDDQGNNPGQIILQSLSTNTETAFKVDPKYHQFGNLKFSPDGQKIAFAAALGDPESDQGFVIVFDLTSHTFQVIKEGIKGDKLFNVYGWKNATTVDYGYSS